MTDSSTDWKRKPLYQNCGDEYRKHVRPDARHIDAGIDDFRRPVRSLSRGTKIKEILRNRVRTECKRKEEEEPCESPCKLIIQEIEKQNSTEILPKDIR